ncbi:MAG TPA: hypothetical protein PLK30_27855 [Blastocatellia bacterium]|nr:hypothetical protein [Blastocatellia bacterium]
MKEGGVMNNLKRNLLSLALTGSFIVGLGALSNADAQGRQRRNEQPQRGGQVESTGNIDRNKNGIDDRFESRDGRVDMNQNGVADDNEYGRYGQNNGRYGRNQGYDNRGYGNQGNYGNRGNYGYGNGDYGYNNNNADFQRGYRDGSDRGREDAQTRRAMTPNNSSHYRSGNQAYRAGFEQGFYESYRRYSNRGW